MSIVRIHVASTAPHSPRLAFSSRREAQHRLRAKEALCPLLFIQESGQVLPCEPTDFTSLTNGTVYLSFREGREFHFPALFVSVVYLSFRRARELSHKRQTKMPVNYLFKGIMYLSQNRWFFSLWFHLPKQFSVSHESSVPSR